MENKQTNSQMLQSADCGDQLACYTADCRHYMTR